MAKTLLEKHAENKWSEDLACEMLFFVTNHENGVSIDVQSAAAKIRRIVAIKSDEQIEMIDGFLSGRIQEMQNHEDDYSRGSVDAYQCVREYVGRV